METIAVETKVCVVCGVNKPLSDYKRYSNTGKPMRRCAVCHAEYRREDARLRRSDPEYRQSERERAKNYPPRAKAQDRAALTERTALAQARYEAKYPEKAAAGRVAQSAGLIRPGLVCHHWSYGEFDREDIIYLTPEQHRAAHLSLLYDKPTMKHRTTGGVLLGTREAHEEFLRAVLGRNYQDAVGNGMG